MTLDDLIPEDDKQKEGHCPECGTEGEETGRLELRCPSDCPVMYWFPRG